MKVIICGAGQVGFGIAERLAAEHNDVTVIDSSPVLIQQITESLDVQGIVGHGAYPDVLQRAGAEDADMIIAVTFTDEVNMMACQVAYSLFNVTTKIARVRAQSYLAPGWQNLFMRDHLPIDVIISPEMAVSEMVLRRLSLPGAFETINFVDDKVIVMGITCEEECPVVNTPLEQLTELFPDLAAVVVGIVRDGKLYVPHSSDQMLVGDDVYLVAERSQAERTLGIFGHEEKQARRIVIAGGGNVGYFVASKLEALESRTQVKIIEFNRDRAVYIADRLRKAVILNGNALEAELLREAGADDTEVFVALTNDDKVNILSSLMAKQEGAGRVLSLVNNSDYSPMLKSLGIDASISPRATTISAILQHVRRGRIRGVHSIRNGMAEVLEAEALETATLVGKSLRDADLPDGLRIGAIVRGGNVVIPDGNTEIRPHDRIVMFALAERVREVEHMFRVSLEYF
jgi:trk system potassium uptake protein TrkA